LETPDSKGKGLDKLSLDAKRELVEKLLAKRAQRDEGMVDADVDLVPEIKPLSTFQFSPPTNVLLTGATGYLGAFLLWELLNQTRAKIVCLVRAKGSADGLRRIREKLVGYGLWRDVFADRIAALPGDVAAPRLGLDADAVTTLATTVDTVYHSAALVNFLFSYAQARGPNVLGTAELLRFACAGRTKAFHFISSVGVFPQALLHGQAVREDATPPRGPQVAAQGYLLSKWASEQLVLAARARGLPVAVYRPSFIGADARSGVFNMDDFMSRLVVGCIQARAAPDIPMYYQVAPVDYVAGAIVALSRQRARLGHAFHLVHPSPPSWREAVEMLRRCGADVALLPYGAWAARVVGAHAPAENALHAISGLVPSELTPLEWTPGARAPCMFDILGEKSGIRYESTNASSSLPPHRRCLPWSPPAFARMIGWARSQGSLS
jgi:thioester reductase-like protein